jgi:hypothetical protein
MNDQLSLLDRRAAMLALAGSTVCVSGASFAQSAPSEFPKLNELAASVQAGISAPWTIAAKDGGMSLVNTTDDNSARYSWTTLPRSPSHTIVASVEIRTQTGKFGGGGLLAAFDPGPKDYMAVVIEPPNIVAVYQRFQGNFSKMVSSEPEPGTIKPGLNEIAITIGNGDMSWTVNGVSMGSVSTDVVRKGKGAGVVGLGIVDMTVAEWRIE